MKSKIAMLFIPILAIVSLVAAGCGDDDGGSVRDLNSSSNSASSGSGSGSGSGSASGSASASASSSGSSYGSASASVASASASASGSGSASTAAGEPTADATPADGGYAYASNVDSHRLVV